MNSHERTKYLRNLNRLMEPMEEPKLVWDDTNNDSQNQCSSNTKSNHMNGEKSRYNLQAVWIHSNM
jgi:hypothetical protein